MSQWHRENPDLVGTEDDPAMINPGYRQAVQSVERQCPECGQWDLLTDDGVCVECWSGSAA